MKRSIKDQPAASLAGCTLVLAAGRSPGEGAEGTPGEVVEGTPGEACLWRRRRGEDSKSSIEVWREREI